MKTFIILWYFTSIPFIFCNSVTPGKSELGNTIKSNEEKVNIKSKITLVSEGGSISPEIISSTLTKPNVAVDLIAIDQGLHDNQEKRPIHPRKGVGNLTVENVSPLPQTKTSEELLSSSNKAIIDHVDEPLDFNVKNTADNPMFDKNNHTSTTVKATSTIKPIVHTKPLVLNYETLASMDVGIDSEQSNFVKPKVPLQSKSPGMVTPIVITILVVPMFAVVGYMALRRGQEAWKNRHYKRMDFLLDGMYNE